MDTEDLELAAIHLLHVAEELRRMSKAKSFKVGEMVLLRKMTLKVVRDVLDESIGHMPDKRHY